MSVSQPARCLFAKARIPRPSNSLALLRPFHSSTVHHARRKPTFPSIKEEDMERINNQIEERAKAYRPFTDAEKKIMKRHYTPAQYEAIEAAEAAINPRDLVTQAHLRDDPWALHYWDDFTELDPLIDKKRRAEVTRGQRIDPSKDFMPEDEWVHNFSRKLLKKAEDLGGADLTEGALKGALDEDTELQGMLTDPLARIRKASDKETLLFGADETAAAIPRFRDSRVRYDDDADVDPHDKRLQVVTGLDTKALRRFRVKTLVIHRVVNQTRMGKIQSMYCLSIAGNENGMLGIGEGKSAEITDALRQAKAAAIKNLRPVPRYEGRTIYGDVQGKVGAVELKLSARPPGFGLRCQHLIFEMARAAGISDLAARVSRARNKMNTVKAAYEALMSQRLPEDIARARGRKLVDVRKVYYGGQVY